MRARRRVTEPRDVAEEPAAGLTQQPSIGLAGVAALLLATVLVALAYFTWNMAAASRTDAADKAAAPAMSRLPGLPGEAPVLGSTSLLPAGEAEASNAAVPFFAGKLDPAAPFRFAGTPRDQSRAAECLALAAMAEAGPSDPGQRAVIQVVLNRVRHPAFAKSICGVVFEGAERSTGCQFSFTCDGSLARRYGEAAWSAARARAAEMLGGAVYAPVGNATHYHTDWVFPYWSPRLVKLARVETHLFFRWSGYWGTPRAMRIAYAGSEPDPAVLAQRGPEAEGAAALAETTSLPALPADTPTVGGGNVMMRLASGKASFVEILPGTGAAGALTMAKLLCNAPGTCRVMGWRERGTIPAAFPLPPAARASLTFSYSRDPAGAEIVLYDCQAFGGIPRDQCIPKAR
jgi:spore germination cell wall hydrolase CwlJ-like protein